MHVEFFVNERDVDPAENQQFERVRHRICLYNFYNLFTYRSCLLVLAGEYEEVGIAKPHFSGEEYYMVNLASAKSADAYERIPRTGWQTKVSQRSDRE